MIAVTADNLWELIAAHFQAKSYPEPQIRLFASQGKKSVAIAWTDDDPFTWFHGDSEEEVLNEIKNMY